MWGTSNDDLYLVGDSGLIMHYDGSAWQRMESGTTINLHNIWGTSANDIWVAGHCGFISRCADQANNGDGILLHYDGSTWTTIAHTTIANNPPLNQLDGALSALWSSQQLLYVSSGPGVYRRSLKSGVGWTQPWYKIALPVGFSFGMHGLADNDLFIVGDGGSILHWNGATWRHYPFFNVNGGPRLWAVSMTPNGEVFAVGRGPNGNAAVYHGKR